MSKEFQHIVSLSENLNQEELLRLIKLFTAKLEARDSIRELQLSDADVAEIRERFRWIESGETKMSAWADVREAILNS